MSEPNIVEYNNGAYDIRGNMSDEQLDAWIKALRSGEHAQTSEGYLHQYDEVLMQDSYCCLGVLLDIQGEIDDANARDGEMLSFHKAHEIGLQETTHISNSLQHYLSTRNDNDWDFDDIANFLEENRAIITGGWASE